MAAGWGGAPVRAQAPEIGIAVPLSLALLLAVTATAQAQTATETTASAACVLKNQVYTCDSAAFQTALTAAKTASIETHSVDKLAQAQLKDLLAKKLAKTIVPDGSPSDLVFLLIPVAPGGMNLSTGEVPLGTLQVYAGHPDGSRGGLLWSESFSGQEDMPWPAVVHSLIARFQTRFHIK
jgi:hypothetical protein